MIINAPSAQDIRQAAKLLKAGALLAFPTETVYGLGADAQNPQAVAQIFTLKGRPKDHPLIVHIFSAQQVHHFATDIPTFASELMARFWPGPLTLILKRKPGVADAACAHQATIGLRVPKHPLALSLLGDALSLGVMGIAAPSANRFGRVSPTQAQHVFDEFGAALMILDGAACDIGIESTIIDCTRGTPILLRPGQLLPTQIECFAPVQVPGMSPSLLTPQSAPKVSGSLLSHYAPRARVRLLSPDDMQQAFSFCEVPNLAIWSQEPCIQPLLANLNQPNIHCKIMPQTAKECARELFATLREFDALGASEIWIQTPPHEPQWLGVLDRLTRAAHS